MKKQYNNLLIILVFILILVIIFNLNAITGSVTQEDCSCINADVNRDKILDVRDLNIIVDCVNNNTNCQLNLADINKDSIVNNLDLSLYNECHRKEIPGSCYSTNLNVVSGNKVVYVYANNQRIAKKDNTGVYYYHNDNLGSPRAISDSNGNVITRIDYKPFGEEVTSSNSKVKYNSKELDTDTNLLYYGARYYSSYNGRFLTADTVKGSLTDPQSLNLYSYTKNNPLKYVDLRGEQGEDLVFGAFTYVTRSSQEFSYLNDLAKERFGINIPPNIEIRSLYQSTPSAFHGGGDWDASIFLKAESPRLLDDYKQTFIHELAHVILPSPTSGFKEKTEIRRNYVNVVNKIIQKYIDNPLSYGQWKKEEENKMKAGKVDYLWNSKTGYEGSYKKGYKDYLKLHSYQYSANEITANIAADRPTYGLESEDRATIKNEMEKVIKELPEVQNLFIRPRGGASGEY